MARVPMVTRSINATNATILCLNIETGASEEKVVTLPRRYKDDTAVLKQAETVINDGTWKAVHVKKTETFSKVYGMTEQEFIDHAKPIERGKQTEEENK